MPTVSVIVPVYRREDWLEQCLASIRSQSHPDVQLIVVDDSHGTGAAAARNRGLAQATGEYIMFCDDDDYLEPEAIARMVAAMEGVDMVCGSFRKFGLFEETVSHPTQYRHVSDVADYALGNLRNPRSNQLLSGCWAKLYRRELVRRFPLLTTAEDMAFNFDYLTRCNGVRFLADTVYHNRKRKGSLSTTFDARNKPGLFGFLKALASVKAFLLRFHDEATIDEAVDNSKVYHSMLYFTRICEQTGWPMRQAMRELYP